ncbi:MAG TPA: flagellar hook-associated protein FlgK [Actinophytocola sp.]|uniref:flagellar hook-associated protein FlgK n=1 Tax=Actinophytocola sp. TaxID=1872138 RepID=UPI002DBB55FA|nr:flagellar hook-associated protein FlgK [Actinophytocola sp.]HEU5474200.1 flagellar hook-associated protein FlgK [Actinophytocola sp.]
MSTFSGLNTALSALKAQRRGLELTGQNIANANTEGYSRQRLETTAVGGTAVPALWATPNPYDGGVNVLGTVRMRDVYLETRAHTEHARQALLNSRTDALLDIESTFDEPSDSGLQARLGQLWGGFTDVADSPGDSAARNQLLVRAQIVATSLNTMATGFATRFEAQRHGLTDTITDINTAATKLADLNDKVVKAQAAGLEANELIDQRDVLVLRLTELAGATTSRNPNGSVDLQLGGAALVTGSTARALTLTGSATLAGQAGDPVTVRFADDGTAVPGAGGKTGAAVEALNVTLPGYAAAMDNVAAMLANSINAVQQGGYTTTGTAGVPFFSGTTAATIKVAITNPDDIAASSDPTLALDGGNADKLAELGRAAGGVTDTYAAVVARIGIETNTATQLSETQNVITAQVDFARLSVAGVNIDEELTSMLAYQRSYQAASRVMTAVDELLDTLINRMVR